MKHLPKPSASRAVPLLIFGALSGALAVLGATTGCAAATQIGVIDIAVVERELRNADANGDGALSAAEVIGFVRRLKTLGK